MRDPLGMSAPPPLKARTPDQLFRQAVEYAEEARTAPTVEIREVLHCIALQYAMFAGRRDAVEKWGPCIENGSHVDARTIKYRDYQFVIQPPVGHARGWHILVWPPSKDLPTIMPAHESEESATRDAQNAVDRLLGGVAATG
jgi:hypothetical protein